MTRSSDSMPTATYSAVAGTFARSASATGLRPTSSSAASALRLRGPPGPPRPRPRSVSRRAAEAARRAAGWPLRSTAGGVGPLPVSARLTLPPEPTWAPFLDLRIAP